MTPAGGRVLAELRPEAPGTYLDRLAEETTVNGRGMTDYDLPAAPHERTPLLVRRCLAYACACLRDAREEFGDGEVKAYVSLSFADTEEGLLTSNVTFCTSFSDARQPGGPEARPQVSECDPPSCPVSFTVRRPPGSLL
ncbi:hypothetical protein SFUL_3305 [Streptomyces microflavus DSM 40593]|uniref:Uncharacterized protein n=1 Tax=Streptomyces microflavus DSM 40593 TaxID=1303692 RepID=N0CPW2_STRMI|nr:hypothetical protein SFUL_3305 [Streptomyces microflavus DSM 40593]